MPASSEKLSLHERSKHVRNPTRCQISKGTALLDLHSELEGGQRSQPCSAGPYPTRYTVVPGCLTPDVDGRYSRRKPIGLVTQSKSHQQGHASRPPSLHSSSFLEIQFSFTREPSAVCYARGAPRVPRPEAGRPCFCTCVYMFQPLITSGKPSE